jgi:hypothetical protein
MHEAEMTKPIHLLDERYEDRLERIAQREFAYHSKSFAEAYVNGFVPDLVGKLNEMHYACDVTNGALRVPTVGFVAAINALMLENKEAMHTISSEYGTPTRVNRDLLTTAEPFRAYLR